MAAGGGTKAIVAALLANLGIAVAKFVGFLITRASSLLAEAVHSVADSGNQALLLFGARAARRPATPAHPFGYARSRYFYAFIVAVVLFALGALFSLYEGYQKLVHPHEVVNPVVGITILVVGIVLELFSFRTAVVESNAVRGDRSWWEFVRHSKAPELPVVLLEDLGALAGLVLALVGLVLAAVTGDPFWDAAGTIAIGLLLAVIAVVLAVEMHSLLLGEAASPRDVAAIRRVVAAHPSVVELMSLKTQHLGPEQLLVAGHLRLVPDLDFPGVVSVIDEIERSLRTAVPTASAIYLEPDAGPDAGADRPPAPPPGTSSP